MAVIGAGITGLSAGRALALRGIKTCVLDAREAGWGASSRNGGMVLTGLKLAPGDLIRRYGLELSRRFYQASLDSLDAVENLAREEKIECHFERCGHLELAAKPAHYRYFERAAEVLTREFGRQDVRLVARGDLGLETGAAGYHGGLADETSAAIHPGRYVMGLARAAQRAGAGLWAGAKVLEISRQGPVWIVRTSRGDVRAEEVFVATGGYTGRELPDFQRRVVPVGSYSIVTEPLDSETARRCFPKPRMVFDSKNYLYYFRLTPDRRLLFGGRAAFIPESEDGVRRSAEILRHGMSRVFPWLEKVPIEYAWGGNVDFSFDMMPHAGKINGIYYALGYAGHGVALSTYLGLKIAAVLCGEKTENPFSETPLPRAPLGLYNGNPWFLPAAEAWYKILDWLF